MIAEIKLSGKFDRLVQWLIVLLAFLSPISIAGAEGVLVLLIFAIPFYLKGKNISLNNYIFLSFVFMVVIDIFSITANNSLNVGIHSLKSYWIVFTVVIFAAIPFDKFRFISVVAVMSGVLAPISIMQVYIPSLLPEMLNRGMAGRASGAFSHPQTFGGYQMIVLIVLVSILINSELKLKSRIFFFCMAFLTAISLLLSQTRGAWLGFMVASVVLLLTSVYKKRAVIILLLAGMLLFCFFSFNDSLVNRVYSLFCEDHTADSGAVKWRFLLWEESLQMAKNNPFLGVGPGMFEFSVSEKAKEGVTCHAHSMPLNVLAETGIAGLSAYMLLWLSIFVKVGKRAFSCENADKGLYIGIFAVLVAFNVMGLTECNFFDSEVMILVWVLIGIALNRNTKATFAESEPIVNNGAL